MRFVRKFFNTLCYNSPIFAHIVIGSFFIILTSFCILTGYLPTHDAIEWHGASHYFYSSVERGVIPYWNPYSQTGTPFFNNFQSFGLLEPSQFVFILLQKITGCTTLTTYILHYFFLYYVFIVGTYYTLRLLTKNNASSLLFSMVLLLACFPSVMWQNGALIFFFAIPFITFFLLLFFQESGGNKKGFYLFVASFFCAITFHNHIPTWLLFYVLLFVVFASLFKIVDIKATVRFLASRCGILWIVASIIVVLLISSPVAALYSELHHNPEYFPSLRMLQNTGNNLVRCYASDLQDNLFSEEFTRNKKVSLTLVNLNRLLLGLFQDAFYNVSAEESEIVLYLSILPLLCIWVALTKARNRYTYFFSAITVLTLLISCNFKIQVQVQAGFSQRMMMAIFPFLKMSDVFQGGGTLFLFCLVILSAIGFRRIRYYRSKIFWIIPSLFLFYRNPILLIFFFVSALILLLMSGQKISSGINLDRIIVTSLKQSAIVILLLDLLIAHAITVHQVLSKQYSNHLQQENLVQSKLETSFINYRTPFSPNHVSDSFSMLIWEDIRHVFNSFFAHEIYEVRKIAFAAVVRAIRSKHSEEGCFTLWDHFYMTKHYYDYLVNVKYDTQLVTSHIITPILNFFPRENAIFAENKYEVVEKLNASSPDELRTYIFIEQNNVTNASTVKLSELLKPNNFIRYTQKELSNFEQNLDLRYPINPDIRLDIIDYGVNHLSVDVETPYDGYVYFGDGYSKHWKAKVDGKETKIEKTNINFKSVYTPAGKHRVDFIFDPVMFRYSLYAYLTGNLIFLAVLIIFFKTRMLNRSAMEL